MALFAVGALVAVAVMVMFMSAWRADAAPGAKDTTLVPVTPCRLVDTRQPGSTPLQPGETRTLDAHGSNGACTLPTDAVGLSMNVTAIGATASGNYWTIWPADAARPGASSLNPAPGQPPTPNAVVTPLSPAGKFKVFNFAGTADMLVDVNGYYTKASLLELAADVQALESVNAKRVHGVERPEDRSDRRTVEHPGRRRDGHGSG